MSNRLISIPMTCDKTRRSKSALYDHLNPYSPRFDPDFPKPVKVGTRTLFVEAEIDAYIQRRIEERDQQHLAAGWSAKRNTTSQVKGGNHAR